MTAPAFAVPSLALITLLSAASPQLSCSTAYQPRQSGRVALVVRHAALLYAKDDRELPVGPFSGNLEPLVNDSPAAAAHARTAHSQFEIGVPSYLIGLIGVVVGIAALSGPVGWVVIGAGATSAGTGLGFMGAGVTHVIDAVNVHNEALVCRPAEKVGPCSDSPVDDRSDRQKH